MTFAEQAKTRIEAGEDTEALVHRLWADEDDCVNELSSSITLEAYQRGGYTAAYRSLGEIANGCWDWLWNSRPRLS